MACRKVGGDQGSCLKAAVCKENVQPIELLRPNKIESIFDSNNQVDVVAISVSTCLQDNLKVF